MSNWEEPTNKDDLRKECWLIIRSPKERAIARIKALELLAKLDGLLEHQNQKKNDAKDQVVILTKAEREELMKEEPAGTKPD